MAENIDQGFARSEQLKHDWALLREEMNSIPSDAPDAVDRRSEIHSRMDKLMNQMADVLTQTRQHLPSQSQLITYSSSQKQSKITSAPTPPTLSPTPSLTQIQTHSQSNSSLADSNNSSPVQYSARRMHIIRRTYDSSDTESQISEPSPPSHTSLEKLRAQALDSQSLSVPNTPTTISDSNQNGGVIELPDLPQDNITKLNQSSSEEQNQQHTNENTSDEDVEMLRKQMRDDANPNATTVTIEGKKLRTGFGELRKGLRDKLRIPDHGNKASSAATKTMSNGILRKQSNLTKTECHQLSEEHVALERESKRLMRKPDRTEEDNSRLEQIAETLSKLSSTLAEVADENQNNIDMNTQEENESNDKESKQKDKHRGLSVKKSMFGGSRQTTNTNNGKPSRMVKTDRIPNNEPLSPVTDEDIDLTFEVVDGEEIIPTTQPPESDTQGSNAQLSKRKKGWMAIEAGVASLRALGTRVRGGNVNHGYHDKKNDHVGGRLGGRSKTLNRDSNGNVFVETTQRLHERGEKLNNTANDAEQMANDADDMLAAVRALRQRKQKGGFFS